MQKGNRIKGKGGKELPSSAMSSLPENFLPDSAGTKKRARGGKISEGLAP